MGPIPDIEGAYHHYEVCGSWSGAKEPLPTRPLRVQKKTPHDSDLAHGSHPTIQGGLTLFRDSGPPELVLSSMLSKETDKKIPGKHGPSRTAAAPTHLLQETSCPAKR